MDTQAMDWKNPRELWSLVRDSVVAWSDDYAPSMGAALAYYTIFSIAPLLVIVIAVSGLFFGREAAQGQIFAQLHNLIGPEGAAAIQALVKSASEPAKGAFATVVGLVMLFIGATTVFGELQSDLDRVWNVPPSKSSGLWDLLRSRVLSFGIVLGTGFLLLVSLVLSAGLAAVAKLADGWFENWEVSLQLVNFAVSFLAITGLFAMIYKLLPRVHIGWHDVWIGAAVTALLFEVGKLLIGLYLGKSGVVSGFGAAGSIVVLLVWVYYSAQIFLLGAEFTWTYAYRYGSRRDEPAAQRPASARWTEKPASIVANARSQPPAPGLVGTAGNGPPAEEAFGDPDELPEPSGDEIVDVLPPPEDREGPPPNDPVIRALRAAERHPVVSVMLVGIGFAAAGFVAQTIVKKWRRMPLR